MSALSKTLSAYAQALALLAPERGKAIGIVLAGMAVAGIQVAEPVLFGHAINALLSGGNALSLVLVWGALWRDFSPGNLSSVPSSPSWWPGCSTCRPWNSAGASTCSGRFRSP